MTRFFDLPPELRNQIYRLLFQDLRLWEECYPSQSPQNCDVRNPLGVVGKVDWDVCRRTLGPSWELTRVDRDLRGLSPMRVPTLTVCRQFQVEVAHLFYRETHFKGGAGNTSLAFLHMIGPKNRASLGYLEVGLGDHRVVSDYVEVLRLLSSNSYLKSLTLYLPISYYKRWKDPKECRKLEKSLYTALRHFENTESLCVYGGDEANFKMMDKIEKNWSGHVLVPLSLSSGFLKSQYLQSAHI
jgi:hypothetical protein